MTRHGAGHQGQPRHALGARIIKSIFNSILNSLPNWKKTVSSRELNLGMWQNGMDRPLSAILPKVRTSICLNQNIDNTARHEIYYQFWHFHTWHLKNQNSKVQNKWDNKSVQEDCGIWKDLIDDYRQKPIAVSWRITNFIIELYIGTEIRFWYPT